MANVDAEIFHQVAQDFWSGRMSLTKSEHILPVLDGLRAISILLVLACHLLPLGPRAWQLNAAAGAMGMSLFFALSGFLITSGLMNNPNVSEFFIRRLARILPLAYLYTTIIFLIWSFQPERWFWTNVFMVSYLPQLLGPGWNAHLWSLCVEVHFYLTIGLVVGLFLRRGLWLVWPVCFVVTALRVHAGADAYISILTHHRVDEILSGACIATIFPHVRPGGERRGLIAAMVSAATLWALSSHPLTGPLQYARPYAAALLLLATLKYGLGAPRTVLASAPLSYIAATSYALYVVHPAMAHGWMDEGGVFTRYLVKRPISFALSFFIAHVSTFYWERPWQMAAKRWIQRRRRAASERKHEGSGRFGTEGVDDSVGAASRTSGLGG